MAEKCATGLEELALMLMTLAHQTGYDASIMTMTVIWRPTTAAVASQSLAQRKCAIGHEEVVPTKTPPAHQIGNDVRNTTMNVPKVTGTAAVVVQFQVSGQFKLLQIYVEPVATLTSKQ